MIRRTETLLAIGLASVAALGLSACGPGSQAESDDVSPSAMTAGHQGASHEERAADLRVTVNRLLGEHMLLAAVAMQKGHDGAKDFEQAAGALEANSADIQAAVGSVYGAEAGEAFGGLWRAHIDHFIEYTVATAGDDRAGREEAQEKLTGYKRSFAAFLAEANPNLGAQLLDTVVGAHIGHLTAAIDAYHAGDHEGTYAQLREGYAHMFAIGDALSGAIVAQFPGRF